MEEPSMRAMYSLFAPCKQSRRRGRTRFLDVVAPRHQQSLNLAIGGTRAGSLPQDQIRCGDSDAQEQAQLPDVDEMLKEGSAKTALS